MSSRAHNITRHDKLDHYKRSPPREDDDDDGGGPVRGGQRVVVCGAWINGLTSSDTPTQVGGLYRT